LDGNRSGFVRAGAAAAFCVGLSRAAGIIPEILDEIRGGVFASAGVAHDPRLVASYAGGFVPTTRARVELDQLELGFLALYFLAAGLIFNLSYRRSRSGVLRQQLSG